LKRWLRHTLMIGSAAALTGLAAVPAHASAGQSTVSPGTFGNAVYVNVPVYSDSVAIGKVTGNGRNDLVVDGTYGKEGYLWMFPQEGDGKLGPPQKFTLNDAWVDSPITITDLYGNGENEVVMAGTDSLLVFGSKDGKLTGPTRIQLSNGIGDFAVVNVNGDRYPDIVSTNGSSKVSIYDGSASHTFHLAQTLRYTGGGVWYLAVFGAAFRPGDRADIAFYDGQEMDIRLRQANGSYGPMTRYRLAPIDGLVFGNAGAAAVGDLTGDGLPDLVMPDSGNQPWADVEVYADTKSGHLAKPVIYPTLDIPGPMKIADLTGNGRNDLIVEHEDWEYIGVMLQGSDHRLSPEVLYPVENCCASAFDGPAVGDLNGDGRPDIAVAAGDTVAILYQK
jgi:hypothetical protein